MNIRIFDGLPFIAVDLAHRGHQLTIANVLLDTGSGGTVFQVDILDSINMSLMPDDEVHRIRGVGGFEYVFTKRVELLQAGNLIVKDFDIELGQLDYGYNINGILGADFFINTNAVIDFGARRLVSV
uniref:Aspartyl protease n=1 Tax=Candidatus Kentrum sp. MB TaxID=2138164 RepID=A0A450X4B6_9GAMM|nr:MAG: Aspartyl protease [Candidatus Kentron sp. MB]VFK30521.1 MAG: Aspartyl protease [Candidatus Kentron sp. MB]VFK75285.1 MAG: Aspartyl protease [Candidatus Kentron sp. MB]